METNLNDVDVTVLEYSQSCVTYLSPLDLVPFSIIVWMFYLEGEGHAFMQFLSQSVE